MVNIIQTMSAKTSKKREEKGNCAKLNERREARQPTGSRLLAKLGDGEILASPLNKKGQIGLSISENQMRVNTRAKEL